MKIAVIGTGYVGLVTGTCFAEAGNDVLCVDNDPRKLSMLKAGQVPIYEPGLEVLFERNIQEGRLHFTDSLAEAVAFSDIIFLALPTPPMEDGSADLQYVLGVAGQIGPMLDRYTIVINKSTVPVGTADKVREAIAAKTEVEFDVISNPEFLREGFAVEDFMKPERIVIGTRSAKAKEKMERLYKPFVRSGNPILFMDERSSELTKYAANSFLATKISFMNEIANLCEKVGANVDNVRRGIGTDSRIGARFLFPGVGYGGSCFPKDVSALFKTSRQYGYHFSILDSVMDVNQRQKSIMVEKVVAEFGEDLSGKTFGVWGLAFKPNTDDIREAPALVIIEQLLARGAKIKAFDPEAMEAVKMYTNLDIEYADNAFAATAEADALLIITEWSEFRSLDLSVVKNSLKTPLIFDGRNIYEPADMDEAGFTYYSIGRPDIVKTVGETKNEQ
ncbi:MAG: UDP-glucose/GDP-mannose dehydrogenase family protein [Bacteroidota bacterium]